MTRPLDTITRITPITEQHGRSASRKSMRDMRGRAGPPPEWAVSGTDPIPERTVSRNGPVAVRQIDQQIAIRQVHDLLDAPVGSGVLQIEPRQAG